VPIAHGAEYRLHGKTEQDAPTNVSYSLVSNYGCTDSIALIESHDIVYQPDGRFVISIDAEPADGRKNHIRTAPRSCFLFIRDTLAGWETERANRVRIERVTPPSRDPLTMSEMGARAARAMFENVPLFYWYQRTQQHPVNSLTPIRRSGYLGGLLSQGSSVGGFHLGKNDAIIARVNPGGARYHSMVAHDMHWRTMEADRRCSSYNPGQALLDADGTTTYVFAHEDPGAANWVDLAGLAGSIIHHRWQALPAGDLTASAAAAHVRLADVASGSVERKA